MIAPRDRPLGGRARCALSALLLAAPALSSCTERASNGDPSASSGGTTDALAVLRTFEAERRRATDFASLPPWVRVSGADPVSLRAIPPSVRAGSACFIGALRGRDAIVVLDCEMRELDRARGPRATRGVAVGPSGTVWATGEESRTIARWSLTPAGKLVEGGSIDVPGVRSLRDIDAGADGSLHAIDFETDTLVTIAPDGHDVRARTLSVGRGPVAIRRLGDELFVSSLFDHALVSLAVGDGGVPLGEPVVVVQREGPIFGFDAAAFDGGALVALGAVEDRPLDRTGGSFGWVDSFVSLVRVKDGHATVVSELNVSEIGVVTPKALALDLDASGAVRVTLAGYGSERAAVLEWPRLDAAPVVRAWRTPPGVTALARSRDGRLAAANPLLDAWSASIAEGVQPVVVADDAPRDPLVRLGEALAFTTLMAPWNKSDGTLSRFTCETCHFEGGVDGRTHHTGRGDVRATTKPLYGLFSNAPHFSRALDPDLTTVAHNEFRVAGARSGHDEWFSLDEVDAPWLSLLGPPPDDTSPVGMRRALMSFLMAFSHAPNPAAAGRDKLTDLERAGMTAFRDQCESCHAARLSANDPATAVPFDRWESLVLSPGGPIVWGRAGYEKTGIEPYVHADGARVPSLRRLARKRPYFTNGSARTLASLLDAARYDGGSFSHHGTGGVPAGMNADARAALLAFLDLL